MKKSFLFLFFFCLNFLVQAQNATFSPSEWEDVKLRVKDLLHRYEETLFLITDQQQPSSAIDLAINNSFDDASKVRIFLDKSVIVEDDFFTDSRNTKDVKIAKYLHDLSLMAKNQKWTFQKVSLEVLAFSCKNEYIQVYFSKKTIASSDKQKLSVRKAEVKVVRNGANFNTYIAGISKSSKKEMLNAQEFNCFSSSPLETQTTSIDSDQQASSAFILTSKTKVRRGKSLTFHFFDGMSTAHQFWIYKDGVRGKRITVKKLNGTEYVWQVPKHIKKGRDYQIVALDKFSSNRRISSQEFKVKPRVPRVVYYAGVLIIGYITNYKRINKAFSGQKDPGFALPPGPPSE